MKKKWEILANDVNTIKEIAEENNISTLLANILFNRGITEKRQIEQFINPTRNDFYDPFLMPDMDKAIDRIMQAIQKQEKVIIYGDYDVDGITATSVLTKFLKDCNFEVDHYIPNRLSEGYGLNEDAIKWIAKEEYTLIITVDCGITGCDEVKLANSLGIDVVITDHHEPAEELPNAIAVVDCKRKDNQYPCNSLAGVGVAFKICQALCTKLNMDENTILKYLDLVAIGTISDIVPLIDENRIIAKLGLRLIEQTRNIGLKSLVSNLGFKKYDSAMVSFGIAPRINACGRMGFEQEALKLFLTNNINEAKQLTNNLNKYNAKRQEIEKTIFEQAIAKIEKEHLDEDNIIVVGNENWHNGVIGIVSSKISELYLKPSILIDYQDGVGKGSGRSIPGFDLHEALMQSSNYLDKFGGHSMAVGLTIDINKVDDFRKYINKIASNQKIDEIQSYLLIDQEITFKDLNYNILNELKELEPFGESNNMPNFIYKNLKIDSIRSLSEGKHLKISFKDGGYTIDGIGFNLGKYANDYIIGDKVDVVCQLEENIYNGISKIQLNIQDIRKAY